MHRAQLSSMAYYSYLKYFDDDKSLAQVIWPKEHFSIPLCAKCGDSLHLDLHELKYPKILHSVRSSYSPYGIERAVYHNLLDDAQKIMDRCQSELRRIQDLSRALEEQQELLGAYLAALRSIISPINRLSQDVLGEIFKNVCCDDIGVNFLDRYSRHVPTMTISRVCISWYHLVVSMPVLWSSFSTELSKSRFAPLLIDLFLERSRLHPIDLEIKNMYSNAKPPSILTAIQTANRWRHLSIHIRDRAVKVLRPLIDGRHELPALRLLTLHSIVYNESSFPIKCSNLRSLTLFRVFLNLEYPRTTLTTLNLKELSASKMCQIILYCPNVQDLTVAKPRCQETGVAPIHLSPNILDLTVAYNDQHDDDLLQLYDSLSLPELTRLELSNPWRAQTGIHHVESLCSMLERSHCHLTHLVIRSICSSSNDLLDVFHCVTSVTTLEVIDSGTFSCMTQVLEALIAPALGGHIENQSGSLENDREEFAHDVTVAPDGRCFLPRLTHLTVMSRPIFNLHLLYDLVRSRRPLLLDHSQPTNNNAEPCVFLQKLHIICYDSDPSEFKSLGDSKTFRFSETLRKSLEPYKKAGMDVDIDVRCKW